MPGPICVFLDSRNPMTNLVQILKPSFYYGENNSSVELILGILSQKNRSVPNTTQLKNQHPNTQIRAIPRTIVMALPLLC